MQKLQSFLSALCPLQCELCTNPGAPAVQGRPSIAVLTPAGSTCASLRNTLVRFSSACPQPARKKVWIRDGLASNSLEMIRQCRENIIECISLPPTQQTRCNPWTSAYLALFAWRAQLKICSYMVIKGKKASAGWRGWTSILK